MAPKAAAKRRSDKRDLEPIPTPAFAQSASSWLSLTMELEVGRRGNESVLSFA